MDSRIVVKVICSRATLQALSTKLKLILSWRYKTLAVIKRHKTTYLYLFLKKNRNRYKWPLTFLFQIRFTRLQTSKFELLQKVTIYYLPL